MSSLLVRPDRPDTTPSRPRPLVAIASIAGAVAALSPLVVLLAVGVVGWFLSDAGAHGAPREGMRMGALAWLSAHGSGLTVEGARLTVIPLGITAVSAWVIWRTSLRAGEALSGHGPDVHSIADGERDWTVPMAVLMFFAGYSVVAVVTATLAAGTTAAPSTAAVLGWALALTLLVAAPGLAIGSGRAAIWLAPLPATVRAAGAVALTVLVALLLTSTLVFVVSFGLGFGEAATMTSRLHTSPGEASLYALVNAVFLPNASVFAGSWLLGSGFTVGAGTLVTPGAVVLGPLPLFPLLAALPDPGTPAGWVSAALALPPLVAALAAVRALRSRVLTWDQSTLAACLGGIVAGVGFTVLAAVAGGAAGPGRMGEVGPLVGDALVHAVTTCAIGALLGAVALLGWRGWRPLAGPEQD
jgi:hypothetical protein